MSNTKRHPQFPLDDDVLYFNHAAVSPWPTCAVDAIQDFSQQNLKTGSSNYLKWMEIERNLRELLCKLINVDSSNDIALLKNTSEGLSVIAYGLDWEKGDNIVIPADEFPSNRIVWQSLKQFGVELRQIDIRDTDNAEQALIDAADDKTRLISVSAVQYTDGFKLDLAKLGAYFSTTETLFVVDAIQQLGALRFDNKQIKADFIIADGHKWMLGPEGLALFYSHPDARSQLKLKQFGWRMIENPTDFNQQDWEISTTATRFECGSPNMLAIFALHASIQLLLETGLDSIEETILSNTSNILKYIENNEKYNSLISTDVSRHSGIVLLEHQDINSTELFKLLTLQGVQCAERGNGIRLSPHFYQSEWEFDRLFNILSSI